MHSPVCVGYKLPYKRTPPSPPSCWRRSATWAAPRSTSARSRPSRRLTARWPCPRPAPATRPRRRPARMRRRRRLCTPSASSRGSQRAPDSQCPFNCMTLNRCGSTLFFFLFFLHFFSSLLHSLFPPSFWHLLSVLLSPFCSQRGVFVVAGL